MTIGTMDIYLLVIIVAALVVGFFWGAARSLMLLAAWLLAFVGGRLPAAPAGLLPGLASGPATRPASARWRPSASSTWACCWRHPSSSWPPRGHQRFFASQALDDVVGALVAMSVAILGIAGLMIVLSTFYGSGEPFVDPAGGPDWTAQLYQSLLDSTIGGAIDEQLVPVLGTILGPILPPDVREVMA